MSYNKIPESMQIPCAPDYFATKNGDILNSQGHVMATFPDKDMYRSVNLQIGPKGARQKKSFAVHRLVCMAYHGMPPTLTSSVNHINTVRHDNRPENLEWMELADNVALAASRTYVLEKDGEQIVITNLAKYCRAKDLSYQMMQHVAHGRAAEYRGYTL